MTTTTDPKPGPWIISNDWRRCSKCYGPAKVVTGGPDGRDIRATCKDPACGDINTGRVDERKESRACKRCGHVYRTVVHHPRTGSMVKEPRFEEHCKACKYDARAVNYANLARDFADRARKERLRQKGTRP
jgi:hypothetical protein